MGESLMYLLRGIGTFLLTVLFCELITNGSYLLFIEFVKFLFDFSFLKLVAWILIASLIQAVVIPILSMIFGGALACCNGRKGIAVVSALWILFSFGYSFTVLYFDTLPEVTMHLGEGFWYYFGATILFANIAIWDFMLLTSLFVRNVF